MNGGGAREAESERGSSGFLGFLASFLFPASILFFCFFFPLLLLLFLTCFNHFFFVSKTARGEESQRGKGTAREEKGTARIKKPIIGQ